MAEPTFGERGFRHTSACPVETVEDIRRRVVYARSLTEMILRTSERKAAPERDTIAECNTSSV